jgi:heptosyltransferase-3
LKNPKKILIIIQRSNGDVLLSQTLINKIFESYNSAQIDILVNDDTILVAQLMSNVSDIHQFSYSKKKNNRWKQEKKLLFKLFKKYDLAINLTASDRSVLYSMIAGKRSISAVERNNKKSWWKKILLTHFYYFDTKKHILLNNLESLNLLKIKHDNIQLLPDISNVSIDRVKKKLSKKGINDFVIFHPSAQYKYKIYNQFSRDKLLTYLSSLGLSIVITGSNNKIDSEIKLNLPSLPNVYNFIGETTIEEFIALSSLSQAYIGMDTLNMHIAASQNKRIFAIFGPTNLSMWSPWSNQLELSAKDNKPIQTYGNVTIFQANMLCVACGKAGCDDNGISECLYNISPKVVFNEIKDWCKSVGL